MKNCACSVTVGEAAIKIGTVKEERTTDSFSWDWERSSRETWGKSSVRITKKGRKAAILELGVCPISKKLIG